jgi:hypothetical protein
LSYSGQCLVILATVAFFVATLSLWSRKASQIALCILAIPWALAGLFGVLFLTRGFVARNPPRRHFHSELSVVRACFVVGLQEQVESDSAAFTWFCAEHAFVGALLRHSSTPDV